MKPQAGPTAPDEIPPIHVLEAAHNQDRKETEDLLAGFDRPGRGPKKPSPERDFVDYYAKKSGGPDSGRSAPTVPRIPFVPRQIDVATVVKPRKTPLRAPPWLGWAAAALLMLSFGGLVAFHATGETRPKAVATATTITAGTGPALSARDIVPPPAPPEPTTTTTTAVTVVEPIVTAPEPPPRPSGGRREPRNAASAGASAGSPATNTPTSTSTSADSKPPPRDDFIRDL